MDAVHTAQGPLMVVRLLLAVVGGCLGLAVLVAVVEQALGRARRSRNLDSAKPVPPGLSALRAQRIYIVLLYTVAPAAVAAGVVQLRHGQLAESFAVIVAFAAASLVLQKDRAPLHLMPVARAALRLLTPAVGAALVVLPGAVHPWEITPEDMFAPLIAAWAIVALGALLEANFKSTTPVRMAILGPPELAQRLNTELRAAGISGYRVEGYILVDGVEAASPDDDTPPCLGSIEDVRAIVKTYGLDLLAVGPKSPRLQVFEQAALACLDLPVRMVEANALYEEVLGHVPIGAVNSAWFQAIMHPRYSPTSPITKRVLDLLIAGPAVVLVAAPLTPLFAFLIKRGDGGSVFYRQPRVGEQGRVFSILKFRSMREGALAQRDLVDKDDLITPVGRVLRSTHLDELPQLFNVLRGDMSIVGPRPEQPDLVRGLEEILPYYERRSLIKPGLTGWAQVRCGYAGTEIGTAWKLCHDLFYLKRRSLVLDLLIIVQTFHILFEASEAELPAPAEEFILGDAAAMLPKQHA